MRNQFNIICDDFFGEKMKENPTLSFCMKITIIIVKLDLVPFVSKNLPSLECKQPKSMNTEKKMPVFQYIFLKESKFNNLNKKIKSHKLMAKYVLKSLF